MCKYFTPMAVKCLNIQILHAPWLRHIDLVMVRHDRTPHFLVSCESKHSSHLKPNLKLYWICKWMWEYYTPVAVKCLDIQILHAPWLQALNSIEYANECTNTSHPWLWSIWMVRPETLLNMQMNVRILHTRGCEVFGYSNISRSLTQTYSVSDGASLIIS